jgi:hypothetical protein
MRNLFYVLAIAGICAALWGTVASILITSFLDRRGIKTPLWLFRLYVFRNIGRYKKITSEESGRPGELYYHCIYAFNAALVLALAALAIRLLSR